MSRIPEKPNEDMEHWRTHGAGYPDFEVSEREPDKVIYGPRGEVLSVLSDRPFLGFHSHYKSQKRKRNGRHR